MRVDFAPSFVLPALIGLAATAPSQAQQASDRPLEQVVVTATRTGEGIRTDVLGSSVTVVSPEQLQERQIRAVSDVLRDVPGVAVNRGGPIGGITQVRVRGTEGNHVLVLIDGMEVTDPFQGEFDFATLVADDVARVEVLRGQQSALYGSDAIGGVIHYMTASGRESPGFSTRIEGGSFNTWEGAARLAGATDNFDYALNGGYLTTDGTPTSHFGTNKVGAENGAVSGRFTYSPTDHFCLKAVARYTTIEAETNAQDFSSPYGEPPYGYVIDSDDYYKIRSLHGMVRAEFDALDDRWRNAISLQGVDAVRAAYAGNDRLFGNDGARLKASYESTFRFGKDSVTHTLTAAADFEREKMRNTGPGITAAQALERTSDNVGVVAQYDVVIDRRIGFGAALRYDDNDRFKNAETYRVQGSYRFDSGTRLRAAAGSGIKNPGMTDLYGYDPDSFIGNPDLKPERSHGWEVGVEQTLAQERVLLGVTHFNSTLKDEIFTVYSRPMFIASPINLTTKSRQQGYEMFAAARLAQWSFDASYTYLDAKENGVEELRRPPHIASLNVGWRVPGERAGLNLTVRYNGETYDQNFTGIGPAPIQLDDFTLVNLSGDFRVSESMQVYARVENLFDEDYEEVYTYRSPGRAAYAGVRLTFR